MSATQRNGLRFRQLSSNYRNDDQINALKRRNGNDKSKLEKDLQEIEAMREEYDKIKERMVQIDGLVEKMEDNQDSLA